jgi:hypothetical protein
MSWPRATMSATSRALTTIVPAYPWSTAPAIAVPHGSQRATTLPVKLAVRAFVAYST